jgi:hypothetical protein
MSFRGPASRPTPPVAVSVADSSLPAILATPP